VQLRALCGGHDFLDDSGLGVRVSETVVTPVHGGAPFSGGICCPCVGMSTQVIPEQEVIVLPPASGRAYVDLHVARTPGEGPEVAVPTITAAKLDAQGLDLGNIARFVVKVSDAHLDVDHRLGGES